MEIFNKSKRTFHLKHPQPTIENKGIHQLKPEHIATVTDAEGTKLIEMYAGELIQIGNSQAEKENVELKKEIANLKNNKKSKK